VKQTIQYCTTADGAKIAYSVTGKGPPIIRTSHWLTHLEHDFEDPVWRHVLLGLNKHHTLIRYDPRGEGMSQRDRTDIDFDAWMLDLDAVVAAVNAPTFALFGCSQGASTAIAYAAAHPERVTRLILYGAFARGLYKADPTAGRERIELAKTMMRLGWGLEHEAHRQWFTSLFMPDGTPELYQAYNRMQRLSASAETAIRHLEAAAKTDVTPLLPKVKTPTLVLHCRDDVMVPFRSGQEIAASIPGARMVPLEGRNHLFMAGSEAHRAFMEATYDFLAAPRPKHLPGEGTVLERWERRGRHIDQNGLIKLALLVLAIVGAVISAVQAWEAWG
jgi:pimeloyl-ACP methyl ester carboxylesterase